MSEISGQMALLQSVSMRHMVYYVVVFLQKHEVQLRVQVGLTPRLGLGFGLGFREKQARRERGQGGRLPQGPVL